MLKRECIILLFKKEYAGLRLKGGGTRKFDADFFVPTDYQTVIISSVYSIKASRIVGRNISIWLGVLPFFIIPYTF